MQPADTDEPPTPSPELERVFRHRFHEARQAGLTLVEATLFAESDADIGHLRALVAGHCSVEMLRDILL